MRRLFFALWPDDTTRKSIEQSVKAMVDIRANKIPAANLHITLSFLGNIEDEKIDSYRQAADAVRGTVFQLVLDRLDCFRRSRILYLGCSHVPVQLIQLVRDLEDRLAGCGYVAEKRPYTPHVTLAKKYSQVTGPQDISGITWPVSAFSLMESRPETGGVSYHVLQSWPLAR